MKNVMVLGCSFIILLGLTAFLKQDDILKTEVTDLKAKETKSKDIREEVWNQLSAEDKKRIIGTWKNAKISKVPLSQSMGNINDKHEIGKQVYLIDFPTKSFSIRSNMIVYVDLKEHKLIGHGYVD